MERKIIAFVVLGILLNLVSAAQAETFARTHEECYGNTESGPFDIDPELGPGLVVAVTIRTENGGHRVSTGCIV